MKISELKKSLAVKIAGVVVVLICLYIAKVLLTNNFHPIVEGEAYRSAQVDAEEINHYKTKYNIQSIISLRKKRPGADWYETEIRESQQLGITYIGFPMDSGEELSDEEVAELIGIMKSAPKPLLIHCENGANRTGLAAALYMAGVKQVDPEKADNQLSMKFGHIPLGIFDSKAMSETFEDYRNDK